MCDYDFLDQQEWIRRMAQLKKEMDELDLPRKPVPAPAAEQKPRAQEPDPQLA